jgi:mono/diheme cytochrome c family protein
MKKSRYTVFLILAIMVLSLNFACGGGETPAGGGGEKPAGEKPAGEKPAGEKPAATPAATPAAGEAAKTVSKEKVAEIYAGRCQSCHGEDGKGKKAISEKIPDFTDAKWQASKDDKKLNEAIADGIPGGKPPMPAWKSSLSPEEIQALVGHVRAFKK